MSGDVGIKCPNIVIILNVLVKELGVIKHIKT